MVPSERGGIGRLEDRGNTAGGRRNISGFPVSGRERDWVIAAVYLFVLRAKRQTAAGTKLAYCGSNILKN